MKQVKSFVRWLIAMVGVAIVVAFMVAYYPWVFSKRVRGQILDVQRVTNPTAVIGGSRLTDAQIHSYSILIQDEKDGRLYTASSEDRQWQVASKGYCVEALLYRYPPWDLEKAGTFFNARIVDLRVCPGQTTPPPSSPPPTSPEAPTPSVPGK